MDKLRELSKEERKKALMKAMSGMIPDMPQVVEPMVDNKPEKKIQVLTSKPIESKTPESVKVTETTKVSTTTIVSESKIVTPVNPRPKSRSRVTTKRCKPFSEYKFQYYNGAYSSEPAGFLTLDRLFEAIKNPQGTNKKLLDQIQDAAAKNDLKLKQKLKSKLPAFTPCVNVSSNRRIENITEFTGLGVLDFDGVDPNDVDEFKHLLFKEMDFIIAVWVSPSRKGVKAIYSIPVAKDVEEYKGYVNGVAKKFTAIPTYDQTVVNPVLPLFIGEDKDILIRETYTTVNKVAFKMNSLLNRPKHVPYILTYDNVDENVRKFFPKGTLKTVEEYMDIIAKIFHSAIMKIDDYGHPQLRGASLALGGYVGTGYLTEDEACELIDYEIENNDYLTKNISGYKKTGREMLTYGQEYPIVLKY